MIGMIGGRQGHIVAALQDSDVILIAGDTGCGKSTFINYMDGCSMLKKREQDGRKVIVVSNDSTVKELAPIGRFGHAQRLVVQHLQFEEVGGFDDSGGAKVGHHGRREADALEPLLDDSHGSVQLKCTVLKWMAAFDFFVPLMMMMSCKASWLVGQARYRLE